MGSFFSLYSDPYDNVRYYTLLKFPFDKKSPPSPDEAQAKIAEVVTIQPPDNSADPTPPGNQAAVLQNDDIIKMAKAGLEDSILIAKIKSSQCQFDTTPDALIALKANGISSAVGGGGSPPKKKKKPKPRDPAQPQTKKKKKTGKKKKKNGEKKKGGGGGGPS